MRPIDSAYDRNTAEQRSDDPGAARYGLVSNHNGPCSLVGDFPSLEAAITGRARNGHRCSTDRGWRTRSTTTAARTGTKTASSPPLKARAGRWSPAPAGEYWTVLVEQ